MAKCESCNDEKLVCPASYGGVCFANDSSMSCTKCISIRGIPCRDCSTKYDLGDVIELIIAHSNYRDQLGEPAITTHEAKIGRYFHELVEVNAMAGVPERFVEAISEVKHRWDRRGPAPLNNALYDALRSHTLTNAPDYKARYLEPARRTELEASEKFISLSPDEKAWLSKIGHDLGAMVK